MKFIFRLFFAGPFLFAACSDADQTPGHSTKDSVAPVIKTITPPTAISMAPLMLNTDSVQVIYYDNPDGDSLRYTRYYKFTNASDSGFLSLLKTTLQQPVISRNEVMNCRSIGKMYLFSKNDPVKTIYFSNREDSCRYLYFIQNGSFVYMELPANLETALIQKKRESKTP
jgi:hypothetical protein